MAEVSKLTRDAGKAAEETSAKSTTAMGQMVQSASRHEKAWDQSGKALLGFGAAVSIGVGLALKSYAEFDKAMSEVQAATHASSGDMELLRGAAIKAGADTAYSAKEAADAITELSKAGVSTKDILSGGLDGALSLAAAGSLQVADAAELAATAMVQFKLKGDQIPHLADLLSAGAGKAQGSVEDLGMALKQGGLVAASTGLSIEETTGGLAAFASAGLIGSDAGTSFKTMLMSLTPNSAAAASEMHKLGISAYDQQGKFIGLSKFAGVLQDSMKGLTDEQRAASMKIIFGSDAVRAANVLYEQGAKGISDWTDKVNDAGYAAATAAIKQDNLSGDIEKVGGSLDSVFLKSGSGANEVLRSLAQSANNLLDMVGEIPGPLLQTGLGLAAVTGAGALLGGTFLTTFPKIIETKKAFDELASSSPGLASGLGKVGKAAGIAAVGLAALQVAGVLFNEKHTKSAEDYAQAILAVSKASSGARSSELDKVFQGWDTFAGNGPQIKDLSGAVKEIVNPHIPAGVQDTLDTLFSWTGSAKNDLGQVRDRLAGLGDAMGDLVRNGGAQTAAKSFAALSSEFEKQGKSAQDALDTLPGYKAALLGQANAAGVTLDKYQLMDLALGVIPPALKDAAKATEMYTDSTGKSLPVTDEMKKKLADVGLNADGTTESLSKLLDAMFATGLATMSARDAESKYQENLDGLDKKIKDVMATQKAGNMVLDQTTGSFDLTTVSGRAANSVFSDLQQSAINTTKAMANAGATQPELQAKLGDTYNSLYNAARGFGMSETKADDLARSALSIPKNVDINTAISNYADTLAKANGLKQAVDSIPTFKQLSINVQYTESGTAIRDRASDAGWAGTSVQIRNGGGLVGFAGGGKVPGIPPRDPRVDNVRARTQNGSAYAIRSGEWIINEPQSKRNDKWLRAINNGLNLDTVFSAHEAPSKSMAGNYGQFAAVSGPFPASGGWGSSRSEVNHTMSIGQVIVKDVDEMANKLETKRRDALTLARLRQAEVKSR